MKNSIHELLNETYSIVPNIDSKIQENVIQNIQDKSYHHRPIKRSILILAIYIMIFIAFGATAYAIYHYLTPTEVATELKQDYLAQAFEGDGAILINESISENDFKITLLGYLPAKNLMSYDELKDKLDNNAKTYIVIAIEKVDKTPMEDLAQPFFITPIVEGINPITFNTATLNGGYETIIHNGIEYRLIHVDSIEIFAKRRVMLAVMSSTFYNVNAFNYNEATGQISKNEDFQGINILFNLPIDDNLGDEEKVNAFIEEYTFKQQDSNELNENNTTEKKPETNEDIIPDIDEPTATQETVEQIEVINASLRTSYNEKYLQMITHDGVVLSEQAVLSNEYIWGISSSWDPRYSINIAKVMICDSDVWKIDDNGQPEYLNPTFKSCEIRFYNHDLEITDTIILDEYIEDFDSLVTSEDFFKQLSLRTSISLDGQYLFIYSTKGYLLYDREQKKIKKLNIDLNQLFQKTDRTVFLRFINEQDIEIYTINIEEQLREPLGTMDITTLEVEWLE